MKSILIFHTGGTIGMGSKSGGPIKPTQIHNHFLKIVPELSKIANIRTVALDNIDSCHVSPLHWVKWLGALKKQYAHYDGFVFTHGTDTMAYTGSAFSFALKKMNKPIVFTGSQRPLVDTRTDGRDNLINAVEMACAGPREVTICFGNKTLRANRATKLSATEFVAFESFNFPPLSIMGLQIEKKWQLLAKANKVRAGSPLWLSSFDPRVFCFKIFPGILPEIILTTVKNPKCKGLVLEAYGAGNFPSLDNSIINVMKLAKKLSKPIVIVSQCPDGHVDLDLYESGVKAKKAGALSAADMTSEAAVVKLMHALGMGLKGQKLSQYFLSNICGERSQNVSG